MTKRFFGATVNAAFVQRVILAFTTALFLSCSAQVSARHTHGVVSAVVGH